MTGAIFSAVSPVSPSSMRMRHPADAFALEADGGAEDELTFFGIKNIDGTDGGFESALDQTDDVEQGFAGVVAAARTNMLISSSVSSSELS